MTLVEWLSGRGTQHQERGEPAQAFSHALTAAEHFLVRGGLSDCPVRLEPLPWRAPHHPQISSDPTDHGTRCGLLQVHRLTT